MLSYLPELSLSIKYIKEHFHFQIVFTVSRLLTDYKKFKTHFYVVWYVLSSKSNHIHYNEI